MKNLLFLSIGVVLFMSCSGVKVTSDYDKTVDFTQHKTYEYYGWVEDSDQRLTTFDKERIEKAFAEEFKSRGLEYVEDGGDLVIALFITAEKKTQTTASTYGGGYGGYGGGYGGYYGYGPGWGWGGGYSSTTYNEYDYVVGTLICDVYDKASEKLIWEGIGTKTIEENSNKRERTIPYSIKQMMVQYPVKSLPAKK